MAVHPELILEMKDQAAAAALALSGQFDARIKELRTAKAELASQQGIVDTQKAADNLLTDAQEILTGAEAESARILTTAIDEMTKVEARIAAVAARESTAASAEADLRERKESLVRERITLDKQVAAASADQQAQQAALDRMARDLSAQRDEITAKMRKLDDKLALLAA